MARVAVDLPLPHLDRGFDYLVPPEMDAAAQVGVRVRVRFAGRLVSGFILERRASSEHEPLAPLHQVISAEPVLHPQVAQLARSVADHYAGNLADVVRAAVPPRQAKIEAADSGTWPEPDLEPQPSVWAHYPQGESFLAALEAGGHPRASWLVPPTLGPLGDWASGFVSAAAPVLARGQGALLLAANARELQELAAAATNRFGKGSFAVLSAQAGPARRYRNFLAISRGRVRMVLGTRAAVFAPVENPGLIALWDDGDDSWAEPHAPYWHAREVAALRAHHSGAALLLAGHARTAEVEQLLAHRWMSSISLTPGQVRGISAAVRNLNPDQGEDPTLPARRLPPPVFTMVRDGLASGPVLIQVPRAGYASGLACANCRTPARCRKCQQPLSDPDGRGPTCRWCGPDPRPWRCPECGTNRLRAPVVGVVRTVEEFGKAFPGVRVQQASAAKPLERVDATPSLVLATPGAEPAAEGGYAAAILLDGDLMLSRPDLRVGQETLRRWLAVVSLVRPGDQGGTVLVVAQPQGREVQALQRLDPAGYAERELADRLAAGFPPAVRLITLEAAPGVLAQLLPRLELPPQVLVTGPFPRPDTALGESAQLTLRCPPALAVATIAALRQVLAIRAARKDPPVRVRVDPQVLD